MSRAQRRARPFGHAVAPWLVSFASCLPILRLLAAELPPAAVHSGKSGQGFLMTHLGHCVLVTAAHVLGQGSAAEVVAAGAPARKGYATLWSQDVSADIAVLEVSGAVTSNCGADFVRGASDDSVARASFATIPKVEDDGSLSRGAYEAPIVQVTKDQLIIGQGDRSGEDAPSLKVGFSGSIVNIGDAPAGMLLDLIGDNDARVLRYEQVMKIVFRLLSEPAPPAPHPSATASTSPNGPGISSGARIVNWSAPATGSDHATENLLNARGEGYWQGPLDAGPLWVDIELSCRCVRDISSITLRQGNAPLTLLVKNFEVFGSSDERNWFDVGQGEFQSSGGEVQIVIQPKRRARYVRLQVFDSFDPKRQVAALADILVN